jgi:hypothetical protein
MEPSDHGLKLKGQKIYTRARLPKTVPEMALSEAVTGKLKMQRKFQNLKIPET